MGGEFWYWILAAICGAAIATVVTALVMDNHWKRQIAAFSSGRKAIMKIEKCDICGKLLTIPVSARSAPWEVITCLSEECEKAADKRAIEYRKNWRQSIPPWGEGP